MDYEKKYKEVLERARTWQNHLYDANDKDYADELSFIFPELKESEDKRIMGEIIALIEWAKSYSASGVTTDDANRWFAWLEKQSEQKPTDNIKLSAFKDKLLELFQRFGWYCKDKTQTDEDIIEYIDAHIQELIDTTQKSADNVEPKFKIGDLVKYTNHNRQPIYKVNYIDKECYICTSDDTTLGDKAVMHFAFDNPYLRLVKQNLADDNVEPKFHESEWITNGDYTWKIVEVKPLDYILQSQDGNIVDDTISHVDEQFHSFTIEDAKDGDVLYCKSDCGIEYIVMNKGINCDNNIDSYFRYNSMDGFDIYVTSVLSVEDDNITPATKEQHDLLFQKMHEARYEWDAEKKELKKIEQKPTIEPKFKVGDYIDRKDGLGCHAKIIVVGKNVYGCEKLIYSEDESPFFDLMFENQDEFRISPDFQQNHTWSEEDEEMFEKILQQFMTANNECKLHNASFTYDKEISFLKSLKGRVQPKQEWSEEDECYMSECIGAIATKDGWSFEEKRKTKHWLKSLKERCTWKPSDEQMEVLLSEVSAWTKGCPKQIVLESLYNDLKKLTEE